MRLGRITVIAMVTAIVVAAMTASVALAQSSSVKGYGGKGGATQSALTSGGPGSTGTSGAPSTESAGSGSLPFTGLDVGLAVGGGLLLLGAGAAITALTPRRRFDASGDER